MTERCGGCNQDTWRKVCWWAGCDIEATIENEEIERADFKAKLRSINFGRVPGGARS